MMQPFYFPTYRAMVRFLCCNVSCPVSIRESLRQSGVVNPLVEAVNSTSLKIQEQASRLITNMSMDGTQILDLK